MQDYGHIRRMYLVDGLSQRQIAEKLGISRNTVAKYCEGNTYPGLRASYCRAASVMTPDILRFIEQCLHEDRLEPNQKQHHTAKRIYERLVEEKSFTGAQSTVRRIVAKLRGHPREAFVPLAFAPGDAMQIDWGEAVIYLPGERTKAQMFCARLAYSCAPFTVCFRRQNTEAFLEGLIQALNFFGGVVRRVLFDNARVAVKEGSGKNAIPQESYAALAAHYCFQTDFCNAASGNEKGLVENLVGWTRRNLLVPVPRVASLAELNQRLRDGCESYIASHQVAGKPHPVAHLLQEERQALLPLPGRPYDVRRTEVCRISLQATVRFQGDAYSVPVQYAGQDAALKAGAEDICIYVDGKAVAEHVRAYGHGTEVLELAHYLPLLERKPRSILQARPVQQALSPRLLHLLQTHAFSAKDLMDILRLCVEKGESCFWRKEAQFLARPLHKDAIKDAVVVKAVDLAAYDRFLEGGEEPCRMQA